MVFCPSKKEGEALGKGTTSYLVRVVPARRRLEALFSAPAKGINRPAGKACHCLTAA